MSKPVWFFEAACGQSVQGGSLDAAHEALQSHEAHCEHCIEEIQRGHHPALRYAPAERVEGSRR